MAIPTLIGVSLPVSSTGAAITPAIPAGVDVNDVVLLIHESDPALSAAALGAVTGYADVTGSPVSQTGASLPTRLTVRWHRATGPESGTVSVPLMTNHNHCLLAAFRGCVTSGNPWNAVSASPDSSTTASVNFPTTTTTAADCLILNIIANGTDIGTAQYSAWANSGLAAPTIGELFDAFTANGTGGGLGGSTGGKAAAGTILASTATGPASIRATMTLALQGAAIAPAPARLRRRGPSYRR